MDHFEYSNPSNSYIKVIFDSKTAEANLGNVTTVFDPKFYFEPNMNNKDRVIWTFYDAGASTQKSFVSNEADHFTASRFYHANNSFDWLYTNNSNTKFYTNTGTAGSHSISGTLQNKDSILGFINQHWSDVTSFSVLYKNIDYSKSTANRYVISDSPTLPDPRKHIVSSYITLTGGQIPGEAYYYTKGVGLRSRDHIIVYLSSKYYIDRGYGDERCDPLGNIITSETETIGEISYFKDTSTNPSSSLSFEVGQTQLYVRSKIAPAVTVTRSAYNKAIWNSLGDMVDRYDIYIDDKLYANTTNNYYTLPSTFKGIHKIKVRAICKENYFSVENKNIYMTYYTQASNYNTMHGDNALIVQTLTFYDSPAISNEISIGRMETPVVTVGARKSVNSNEISWTEPTGYGYEGHSCRYVITVTSTDKNGAKTSAVYYSFDNSIELPNLKQQNSVNVKAQDLVDDLNSSVAVYTSIKLSKISLRTFISSRTGYASLTYTWSANITYCDSIVFNVNGTDYTTRGTISSSDTSKAVYTINDLKLGTNTIKIKGISKVDSEFDSSEKTDSPSISVLEEPKLSWVDYPSPDPNEAYVKLSWNKVPFALAYELYHIWEYYNVTTGKWEDPNVNIVNLTSVDNQASLSYMVYDAENVRAKHTYFVQAIIDKDHDEFKSGISSNNRFEYEHSLLEAPVIKYRENGKSLIVWDPSDDEHVDRYLVTTYANGISDNIVNINRPTKAGEQCVYNPYVALKNPNSETLTYSTYVIAMSNNAFYYYPSPASNVLSDYQGIVLPKVTPSFNYDTGLISWDAVDNARGYLLSIKSTNGTVSFNLSASTTTYDISSYTQDLYTISIQALGSGSSIEDRPYYLDSYEIGMISVGILNPPVITRNNNVLSWETVGADYYDIFKNDLKVNTVYDGTSNTSSSTVKATLDAEDVGTYSYKVKAYYRGTDGELFESNYSNIVTVEVNKLDAPEIYFENGLSIVHWNAVDNVEEYVIYVGNDDVVIHQNLNDLSHILDKDVSSPTYYPVTIRAVNNSDHFAFIDSDDSNELKYYVHLLRTPELSLNTETRRLTWTESENANFYTLTINNVDRAVSSTFFDISQLGADTYTAYVKASPAKTLYTNPKYIQSKASNIVTFGTLATPVISLYPDSTRIVWDEIENADFYDIYNDGEYLTSTNLSSYTLSSSTPKIFTVYVVARSNSETIFDSNASNTIQLTFVKIDPVQNASLKDSTGILSWTPVANARGYAVYSNDKVIASLYNGETSYNLTQFFKETIGLQEIYVIAIGSYLDRFTYYLDSDQSNIINKIVQATQEYNVVINGTNYTTIQLPFKYTATIDESLDTAQVTICHINRKEPFEAYSEATLCLYDSALENPTMEQNMLVSTDDVTEVVVGTKTYYNHALTLIERTRLLQSEIMPSFTVTQPEAVINSIGTATADPKRVPGTYFWYRNDYVYKDVPLETTMVDHLLSDGAWYEKIAGVLGWNFTFSNWIANKTGWKWLGYVTNPVGYLIDQNITAFFSYKGVSSTLTPLRKEWKVGDTAVMPVETAEPSWTYRIDIFGKSLNEINVTATTTRRYYIRKHAPSPAYNSSYPETIIGVAHGYEDVITYTFKEAGDYDIIMEIDDITDSFGNTFGLMSTTEVNNGNNHLDYRFTKTGSAFTDKLKPVVKNTAHYRVVWNVQAKTTYTEATDYTSIKDVLLKIIDIVDPIDVNEKSKYTIQSNILSKTQSLKCPELSIQNGKTLYEVLSILGREFNGIPRLLKNNVITYDILNETTSFNIKSNNFRDKDVEASSQSSIDNHATGFISNVSNLISDTFTTIYPPGDLYCTARADINTSTYMDISSMVVEVDQPIYKFCNLFATHVFTDSPDTVIDLTEYVYEKTIYDTLPDTNQGKGKALYYKQGDNKIYGLGQIPAANGLFESLGWSEDTYVLQNIINGMYHLLDNNDSLFNFGEWTDKYNKMADIQFKVRYVPQINTVTYIEQSTITDLSNYNYKNYNQEDNIVSDSRLFKSADEQLKRLGNNSIQRLYTTSNMSEIPLLGYQMTIDNDTYYMDAIVYEFNNRYIDSSVNLSKNINKIDERIGVDSSYRKYEIYGNNYINRTLNFNDYCFIDFKQQPVSDKLSVNNWSDVIVHGLYGNGTLTDPYVKPDAFYIRACRDTLLNRIYWKSDNVNKYADGILISAAASSGNNSIQFSGSMMDNFSAGTSAYEPVRDSVFGTTTQKMRLSDARYVDNLGKCDYMEVTLTRINSDIERSLTYAPYSLSQTLPKCNWIYSTDTTFKDTAIFHKNIKLWKDNREKISFNYQMHFISKTKDIYIHPGLTKYIFKNPSIKYIQELTSKQKPVWVGYRNPILSKNVYGESITQEKIGDFEIIKSFDNKYLTIKGFDYNANGYIGYALVWPETKEILLDIRKPINGSGKTNDIYLSLSNIKI